MALSVTCVASGATFDGILPFTSGTDPSNYDISTPNNAFWSEVDNVIATAAADGLVVLFDPIEASDYLPALRNAGPTKAFNFGVYIGNRYANSPNIIWRNGEDFQTWNTSSTDNNLVVQVMAGIASVDKNHIQTAELNYQRSYTNQDTVMQPYLNLSYVYTYYETYDYALQSYNSSPTMPSFLGEANYDAGNDTGNLLSPAGPLVIRRQTVLERAERRCGIYIWKRER